ncbi:MAG: PDZ domain-containing protein [Armatimonadota bacterium]|jgi:membrane-associated protease RseP (regulator of RpoE activity)
MKPLLSPRVVLLVAAIVFVALMLWVRTHPEKPPDPVMDAVDEMAQGIGFTVQPVPGPEGGLPVLAVKAGSPADHLGFRKGDRILAVGDRSIWHAQMLSEQLSQNLQSGMPFPVLVNSSGTFHSIILGRSMRGPAGRGGQPAGQQPAAAGQQRGRGQ